MGQRVIWILLQVRTWLCDVDSGRVRKGLGWKNSPGGIDRANYRRDMRSFYHGEKEEKMEEGKF
ncbi:unnamed protein product [Citrullus colocynthis]|uniref:Secreted protein n=1 Tax=Citrullus colocynthis TaxID=252529 RepID=A0ABP0Z0B4_9ROSI